MHALLPKGTVHSFADGKRPSTSAVQACYPHMAHTSGTDLAKLLTVQQEELGLCGIGTANYLG